MTPPRDGEKGGETQPEAPDEWTEERIADAQRKLSQGPRDVSLGQWFHDVAPLLRPLLEAVERRNASLAAKDAEIAKLRADLAVVRHGIGEPAAMTPALMAVEMQRLRLANVELRAALEPFADIADRMGPEWRDGGHVPQDDLLTVADLRRAAEALASGGEGKSDG